MPRRGGRRSNPSKAAAAAGAFGANPAVLGGSAAASFGGGLPTTVTLAKGTESEAHGLTFAEGEVPLRITAIAEGSPATKGFGMNAKVGQVLVAMKDQSAGGFMAPKQDVTGIGEAEVLELLAKSGRPLVLSFKAAGGAAAASPVALAGASVPRPVAIAEGNSGAGPSAKQAGGGFGLGGAVTSPGAGPRDHTHTHTHI